MTGGGRLLPLRRDDDFEEARPVFQRIAVVGLGLVGASLAMALRQAWPTALVIGVDNHGVLEAAIRAHVIDVGADDLMIVGDADLVVLAAPPGENQQVLGRLADVMTGSAVVTDVGGAGGAMLAAAATLPDRLAFVGGDPGVESTGGGIAAARADMFRGRRWLLTPRSVPEAALDRLREMVRAAGGEPVVVQPHAHDRS